MTESIYVGHAQADALGDRGWLLGHFKPEDDVRHSQDVEIKWGVHPKGEERAQWVHGEKRTALLVLISGRFRLEFPGRSVVLERQGDYVVWGVGGPLVGRRGGVGGDDRPLALGRRLRRRVDLAPPCDALDPRSGRIAPWG
ncbi:hypothetical protein ACFQGX_18710 [Nonomuraea dietziae]